MKAGPRRRNRVTELHSYRVLQDNDADRTQRVLPLSRPGAPPGGEPDRIYCQRHYGATRSRSMFLAQGSPQAQRYLELIAVDHARRCGKALFDVGFSSATAVGYEGARPHSVVHFSTIKFNGCSSESGVGSTALMMAIEML